jgi:hypothetical protein
MQETSSLGEDILASLGGLCVTGSFVWLVLEGLVAHAAHWWYMVIGLLHYPSNRAPVTHWPSNRAPVTHWPSNRTPVTHWPSEAHIIRRYFLWRNNSAGALATSVLRFLDHTQLETLTHGRIPLHEWSARHTEAATYTTQNKHRRRKTLPSAGFEPAIPEIERSHTYSLDRTATGIGQHCTQSC